MRDIRTDFSVLWANLLYTRLARLTVVTVIATLMIPALLQTEASAESRAFVVGVNTYEDVDQRVGCAEDAAQVAALLHDMGYGVVTLTDRGATRSNILSQLKMIGNSCGPNDRFVFYFAGAGTGTKNGDYALLPTDAKAGSDTTADIEGQSLDTIVQSFPAKSRTVIVDAGLLGGMRRTIARKGRDIRLRYQARFQGATVDPSLPKIRAYLLSSPICYAFAANGNEVAAANSSRKDSHGIFTHALCDVLKREPGKTWEEILRTVRTKTANDTDGQQHPVVSPRFLKMSGFGTAAEEDTSAGPRTDSKADSKGDSMNDSKGDNHSEAGKDGKNDKTDKKGKESEVVLSTFADVFDPLQTVSEEIALTLKPAASTLAIGQAVTVTLTVTHGMAGYLVVLHTDPSGTVDVLFPDSGRSTAAKIAPDYTKQLDALPVDKLGQHSVRAVVFASAHDAEALLQAVGTSGSLTETRKRLDKAPLESTRFVTATLNFEIAQPREVR